MSAPRNPPFSILPVTDISSAHAAIQDIYGKLAAVTQAMPPAPVAPSPALPVTAPGFRVVLTSVGLQASDSIVSFLVPGHAACSLPMSADMPSVPYIVQNQAGSGATINFQSPTGEKINNVAAASTTIAPGHSLTIVPTGSGWIIVNKL